jgi:MSHA pilin protein MshD
MNNKGFTLIETVMVIVLFSIIMPGIMFYFMQGVKDSAIPQRRTTAIFLAESLMEEIRSKRWDEVANTDSTCSNATAPASLGPDAEARIGFDDIDDFNGLSGVITNSQGVSKSTDYPGFTQQASVRYVDATNLEGNPGVRTCYKRIEVRIIDATKNETTMLTSLMTSY